MIESDGGLPAKALGPPRRLLFVNSTSEIGGADIDLLEICRHLDHGRFSPTVVLPRQGPLSAEFEAAGVRVVYCDPAPVKRFRTPTRIVAYPFRLAWATIILWRLIRREGATIVHVNTAVLPAAGFAAKLAGVSCVWHVREIELLQRSRVIGALLRGTIRLCADRIVAISHAVAKGLGDRAQAKMSVIHHGVDTARFSPEGGDQGLRADLGIPSSACVIGFVGRLSPIKGLDYLIAGFAEIRSSRPDAYLLLVGPVLTYEDHFARLRQQVNELGISKYVVFLPDHRHVPSAIRAMDVIAMPSIVPEGLGIAILEGLASGRPVIATNHGGPVEVLTGCPAGRLVPPRDPAAIAKAALELLSLPSDCRQRLRAGARCWVIKYYSIERMITRLMEVYDTVSG